MKFELAFGKERACLLCPLIKEKHKINNQNNRALKTIENSLIIQSSEWAEAGHKKEKL